MVATNLPARALWTAAVAAAPRLAAFAVVCALSTLAWNPAWAQPRKASCDSCESCTAEMARPGAKVEVTADIVVSEDGACIVAKGNGAILDGLERDLRKVGGTGVIGVRIEANDVLVKNLHVIGTDVGIEIAGASRATLFHNRVEAVVRGVNVAAAPSSRLVRNTIVGGQVGVAFGGNDKGGCDASARVESPAAVLNHNHIERSDIGVLGCRALPLLKNNTVTRCETGVRLAAPAGTGGKPTAEARPHDACICEPSVDGVSAGTALFYSSGCSGCQVHEGWLEDLRKEGHDVIVRATGADRKAESKEFDDYMDRCTPQVTDAIGIAGCVPNYVCLTNDATFKIREGDDRIVRETPVSSSDELAAFETACRAVAKRSYRGSDEAKAKGCVIHQLHDNVLCGNSKTDLEAHPKLASFGGAANACAQVSGVENDAVGCTETCPADIAEPAVPAARLRPDAPKSTPPPAKKPQEVAKKAVEADTAAKAETPKPAAEASNEAPPAAKSAEKAPEPSAPDVPAATAEAQSADASTRQWMFIGAGLLIVLAIGGTVMLRRRGDG